MHKKHLIALTAACLMVLVFGALTARASERCDIAYVNSLDQPIVAVKTLYDTPYGEPRPSSSEVILPPGGEYRLGIQGVTLPTRIILYLPLSAYEFTDLSGLAPEAAMRLEVAYEDGVPLLKRTDGGGQSVHGLEHKYLSPENRACAVDRDRLSDAVTLEDINTLVADTVKDVRGEEGETNLDNILFIESFDTRTTLSFPIFWTEAHAGYASATPADLDDPDAGLVVTVNVPLPAENAAGMLDDLMSDLRVDGYRPAIFRFSATGDGEDREVNFLEGDKDKYDDQDVVQEHLAAALEKGTLREAEILWTKEEAFDKAKAYKESPEGPGVRIRLANGQFQALFLP